MTARLLGTDSPLRTLRRQRRFAGDKLCILLPKNDYYVQAECCRALRALGHRVVEVVIGQMGEGGDPGQTLGALLRTVVAHRPDMLLSINYTGFDRAAWLDEIVDAMGLPSAVWFVDSPFFLAMGYLPPAPAVTSFFAWDRSYVPVLRAHGAQRVHHLPLATDLSVFAPAKRVSEPPLRLGFVGHTMQILARHWREQAGAEQSERVTAYAARLLEDRDALHTLVPVVGPPIDPNVAVLAAANYTASATLRRQCLATLRKSDGLHVFGDPGWKAMLPVAHVHGTTAYGPQTCEVYRQTAVNVNVTNLQMPTGVNQRVFDVPASGAFLLTDKQRELEHYFEPNQEVAVFEHPEQMAEMARYFAKAAKARQEMVARAQRRVQAEHTYEHRMRSLVDVMRQTHGAPKKSSASVSQHANP